MSAEADNERRPTWYRPHGEPGTKIGAVTRVAHQGGPRHGTVAEVLTAVLSGYLVYDGPRWFGVYQQADPPRTVSTPDGPAEVWVAIDG